MGCSKKRVTSSSRFQFISEHNSQSNKTNAQTASLPSFSAIGLALLLVIMSKEILDSLPKFSERRVSSASLYLSSTLQLISLAICWRAVLTFLAAIGLAAYSNAPEAIPGISWPYLWSTSSAVSKWPAENSFTSERTKPCSFCTVILLYGLRMDPGETSCEVLLIRPARSFTNLFLVWVASTVAADRSDRQILPLAARTGPGRLPPRLFLCSSSSSLLSAF